VFNVKQNTFNAGTTSISEPGRRLLKEIAGKTPPKASPDYAYDLYTAYRWRVALPAPSGVAMNDWRLAAFGAVCTRNHPLGQPDDSEAILRGLILYAELRKYQEELPETK
jgi:hypothetical protein